VLDDSAHVPDDERVRRVGNRFGAFAAIAFLALQSLEARADPPKIPPAPEGMGQKQRLTDDDYARKKEKGYVTGLPLANYDPNTGFGLGARAYYYWDGTREDPLFAYTPYRHRVFLQAFASTGGLQFHWLDYDAPNIFDSQFRLRAGLVYERQTQRNYFGLGSRGMRDLTFPGAPGGRSYASFAEYDAALHELQPGGKTYALYDKSFFERPVLLLGIERSMFGGLVRPFLGFGFSYAHIRDYSGDTADAIDASGGKVKASMAETRLHEDCAAGLVVGCDGGFDNALRVGLSFDSRDFEPDPNSGVFADLSVEVGSNAFGSRFQYVRGLLAVRGYFSPIPSVTDLVLAARGVYEVQSSGVPFFTMDIIPFLEDNRAGLGGVRTLRGFVQDRFVGSVIALTNFEMRWTFLRFKLLEQNFGLIAVPFLDLGRVFDRVSDTTLRGFKRSQGAGLRIAWNLATIIMIDYGISSEGTGLYINFNHIF